MRTDVKIGLFLGVAALLLAGWFYWPVPTSRTVPVGETGRPLGLTDRAVPTRTGPTVEPLPAQPGATASHTTPSLIVPPAPTAAPAHTDPAPVAVDTPTATPATPAPTPAGDSPGAPLVADNAHPEPAVAEASKVASASPETPGAAEIGHAPLTVVVRPGQTLEQIADEYYKDGDRPYDQAAMVKLLRQANPQIAKGKRLRAGSKIRIPDPDTIAIQSTAGSMIAPTAPIGVTHSPVVPPSLATVTTPVPAPATQASPVSLGGAREYKVQRGDTLYSIARSQLGDSKRWHEVLDLNTLVLGGRPQGLKPGQVLRLPS